MAARITDATGVPVDLVVGAKGEFSVRVGDRIVAQKGMTGFPDEEACVRLVQEALAR